MKVLASVIGALAVSGCYNMPTPANQIMPAYVSSVKYENLDCQRLLVELDALNRRESQLAAAQEQRVKSSEMQAFWKGYGQGDGIEANELSAVRGEKEAVQKQVALKTCKT